MVGPKRIKLMIVAVALGFMVHGPASEAQDSASREFVMSCTYGVLAGTLVGAAMLAFTDQPGENLSKVARGASIGLYTGILLGLYVVYGVSDTEEEPDMLNGPSESWRLRESNLRWALVPSLTSKGVDGAALTGEILSF